MKRRTAAVLLVVGATFVGTPGIADAQRPAAQDRVRDIVPRVRDINFRWSALDNSERTQETAERTTVTFAADVLFEFDSADLTAAAQTRLAELATQLTALGARPVSVAGHTDGEGEPAYNQDLSLRRATAVQAALSGRLGPTFTFDVAGLGETKPVAADKNEDGSDNPAGRAANRRVDISFPNR